MDTDTETSQLTSILAAGRKRKRSPKHPVHRLFEFFSQQNESVCKVNSCGVKVPGNHAGNLMAHLDKHHRDVHASTLAEWTKIKGKKSAMEQAGKKAMRHSLNGVQMSGPALQVHCLRLITEHGLSFQCLDYDAFQNIVKPLLDAMPKRERPTISSTTTPTQIRELAEIIRGKMHAELEDRLLSLQVDGCCKKYRHFIGINVQYVKDAMMVVRTLAVEELLISATAQNLKAIICQILRKYGIPIRNIISFTSDNGANYMLAGKLMSHHDTEDELDDASSEDEWLNVELTASDFSIQSVRCAAHTLQLAVDEVMKAENMNLKPLLDSIRELAKFLRIPTNMRQLKEAGKKIPLLDVVTRWGSTYDMVQSVCQIRLFFEKTMQVSTQERTKYGLSEGHWAAADGFLSDMRPIYDATIQLQAKDLTLGQFLGIWIKAKMKLERRSPSSKLADALLRAMDSKSRSVMYRQKSRGERLSPLFGYSAFNAAVFLDPRFFSLLDPEQIADAKCYLVSLWERLRSVRGMQLMPETDDSDEDCTLPSGGEGDDDFAKFLAQKNKARMEAHQDVRKSGRRPAAFESARFKLRETLDQYDRVAEPIALEEDVLFFWEKNKLIWPELYELALIVLAVPATQVSVERLFSSLRYILRPQRFSLSAEHLDDIVLLHANRDLVRQVAQELLSEGEEVTKGNENCASTSTHTMKQSESSLSPSSFTNSSPA